MPCKPQGPLVPKGNAPCRLLEIPLELRHMIFDYAIWSPEIICCYPGMPGEDDDDDKDDPFQQQFSLDDRRIEYKHKLINQFVSSGSLEDINLLRENNKYRKPRIDVKSKPTGRQLRSGLLLANKQLSTEFMMRIYEKVTFTFVMVDSLVLGFDDWPKINQNTLHNLRHVKFVYDETRVRSCHAQDVKTQICVPSVLRQLPSLRTLSAGRKTSFATVETGLPPFNASVLGLENVGSQECFITDFRVAFARLNVERGKDAFFEIPKMTKRFFRDFGLGNGELYGLDVNDGWPLRIIAWVTECGLRLQGEGKGWIGGKIEFFCKR